MNCMNPKYEAHLLRTPVNKFEIIDRCVFQTDLLKKASSSLTMLLKGSHYSFIIVYISINYMFSLGFCPSSRYFAEIRLTHKEMSKVVSVLEI